MVRSIVVGCGDEQVCGEEQIVVTSSCGESVEVVSVISLNYYIRHYNSTWYFLYIYFLYIFTL